MDFLKALFVASISFVLISCAGSGKSSSQILVLPNQARLAVLGAQNDVKDESWRDERVGLGLRLLLAQELSNTQHFKLIEEKPEIKEKLAVLAAGIWSGLYGENPLDNKELLVPENDVVAMAKVIRYGKPRTKASFGMVHMNTRSVEIEIEVTLKNMISNQSISARGKGSAKQVAKSILFEFRENNVELDKTTVGNATKEALKQAVQNLMQRIQFNSSNT